MVLRGTVPGVEEDSASRTALWVTPVSDVGGVARHVLDVARAGIPGWRVVVLCPEGVLAESLRAEGHAVLTGQISPEYGARAAVATIRTAVRHLGADVLHTHLAFADLAGVAAVPGLRSPHGDRIRVVSTEHGISGVRGLYQASTFSSYRRAWAHRARLYRTDLVIAVSMSTREQVLAQWGAAAPIVVIRNGVDSARQRRKFGNPDVHRSTSPRDLGLRVLSLSRLSPEKGIGQLLEAFSHVLAVEPGARLTIAGDGALRHELLAIVDRLELAESVDLPGTVDANTALAEHDVVAQLSTWENLSYTLLDAVSFGRGVVASPVGGNLEIVPRHCLADPDDPDAVAAVILDQARHVASRPQGPPVGGSVADMTAAIAAAYATAGGGR